MYQEKKRERRRRDYLRMKKRARMVQARWWDTHHTDPDLDDASGKLANNLKICSCSMCGNPRRTVWLDSVLTMQERKALSDAMEQMEHMPIFEVNIKCYEHRVALVKARSSNHAIEKIETGKDFDIVHFGDEYIEVDYESVKKLEKTD